MNSHLNVVNINSSGCVSTICTTLDALDGVNNTLVNMSNGAVIVDTDDNMRELIITTLSELGYPEAFDSKFKNSLSTRAKSFISCLKGRLKILNTAISD